MKASWQVFSFEVPEPPVPEAGVRQGWGGEVARRLLPYEQAAVRGLPMRA